MQYLPTYWKAGDGMVCSEDRLLARLLSGEFAGSVLILEDYRNLGSKLPFRHTALKVIPYGDWTAGAITAIQSDNSARVHLRELFESYEFICLPDMDLIREKDSNTELLAQAILETLPKTNIVILGDQLSMLTPYLLDLLEGHSLRYTIFHDA